jgi:hypothetical protein
MAKKEDTQHPVVGKKPTRDDLDKAIETVRAAAGVGVVAEISDQEMAEGPLAFEAFMSKLDSTIRKYSDRVKITELEGWMKIEGRQGHKVYITKTKTVVNRVESTLDPDLIKGATPMAGNGKIASVLPATVRAVNEAIQLLATLDEPIRPPRVGVRGRE